MTRLVLTREKGERIVIEGGIVVEVVAVRGGKVRLAIEAPAETKIAREEIAEGFPELKKAS